MNKVRDLMSKVRNLMSKVGNLMSEVRNLMSKVRDLMDKVGDLMSEVRDLTDGEQTDEIGALAELVAPKTLRAASRPPEVRSDVAEELLLFLEVHQ